MTDQLTLTAEIIIFGAMRKRRQISKGIVHLAEYRAQGDRRRRLQILAAFMAAGAAFVLVSVATLIASY